MFSVADIRNYRLARFFNAAAACAWLAPAWAASRDQHPIAVTMVGITTRAP
jgi:hypothetical protein